MIDKVRRTITEHNMITEGERVLAALSGGADSVSMLYCLLRLSKEMGFTLAAAHVNHGIRGCDADSDELFCRSLCREWGIELYCKRADVPSYARENGLSEETAGRDIRYSFFKSAGFDKIATAHNRNDFAETLIMHIARGCGLDGLCSIPYMRGNIIRPILDVTRAEIESFCRENGLSYVTDKTNFQADCTRNKVRLNILPLIEEINPNFINTAAENAVLLRRDAEFIDSAADEFISEYGADAAKMAELDEALFSRAVQKLLKKAANTDENFSRVYIDGIRELVRSGKSGKGIDISKGLRAEISFGRLVIKKRADKDAGFDYRLRFNEECEIPEAGIRVLLTRAEKGDKNRFGFADGDTLRIRSRRAGDIFKPVALKGTKKVKDYFIENKVPADEREKYRYSNATVKLRG